MGQNHILQLLTMIAMEPPSRLLAEDIRDEKVKVLRSLRPYGTSDEVRENVVRAQYIQGLHNGKTLPAYRQEDKVDPESSTETYFAARVFVDNFRWAGVPFYIRTGKRLPVKTTEVVVEFKGMPTNVYLGQKHTLEPNLLVIRVNPMEGIYVKINAKKPGSESEIQPLAMDFCQSCLVGINSRKLTSACCMTRHVEIPLISLVGMRYRRHGRSWIVLRRLGKKSRVIYLLILLALGVRLKRINCLLRMASIGGRLMVRKKIM